MGNSFNVITVGNATVDIFLTVHDTNKHFKVNEQTSELCVKQGDKILIDNAKFLLGGNAANVAVGLKKLGLRTAIVAEIGEDEFSQKILNGLKKEGVGEELIIQSKNEISPFSLILNYKNERTIFTENTEKEHDFYFTNCNTEWIYLTSLNKKWIKAYEKTLEYAKLSNAKIVFNPGTSQIDAGENHISNILERTEILIVNKDEAIKILNIKDQEQKKEDELLKALKASGPKIVVITNGQEKAYCIDNNEQIYYQEPPVVKIVEKTGAGDAFSSGFLAAIINKKSIQEAMLWGCLNATSVIGKIGAQIGLLEKDEIKS